MGIKRVEPEFGLGGDETSRPAGRIKVEPSRKCRGRSVTATSPDRQPGELSAPGLVFLGRGGAYPHRLEAERHAIGDANGAGGSAAIRPDTVIRLFHRETASRPQRGRSHGGAE